jgi:hypothetical protein
MVTEAFKWLRQRLRAFLWIGGGRKFTEADNASVYRRLIGRCPSCQMELTSHEIVMLSSVIPDPGRTDTLVDMMIECGDWSRAAGHESWSPTEDAIEFDLLICTRFGRVVLLKIWFPYSLDSQSEVLTSRTLSAAESHEAMQAVAGRSRWPL